jgi:hypothetical protein
MPKFELKILRNFHYPPKSLSHYYLPFPVESIYSSANLKTFMFMFSSLDIRCHHCNCYHFTSAFRSRELCRHFAAYVQSMSKRKVVILYGSENVEASIDAESSSADKTFSYNVVKLQLRVHNQRILSWSSTIQSKTSLKNTLIVSTSISHTCSPP